MEQEIQLNEHNKQEYPPMHTADFNPSLNDIIIYQTEDGEIKLDVKMEKDNLHIPPHTGLSKGKYRHEKSYIIISTLLFL